MANLGTMDMANAFAQQIGANVVKNGTDSDKLAYLLGSYLGNMYGKQRNKKDNKKLDDLIESAQQAPVEYSGDTIGVISNPEQVAAYDNQAAQLQSVINSPATGINEGQPLNVGITDEAISNLSNNAYGQFVQKPTNGGMNNYNWDYIEREARNKGISDKVLEARKANIQKDIAQRARETLLPQIQQDLYGRTVTGEDGKQVFQPSSTESILQGMERLNELAKYDPETAKAYSNLAVTNMQNDKNNQAKLQQAMAVAQLQGQNRLALRNANIAAGYTPNGGSPRQARSNMTKVTMSDYKSAIEGMNGMKENYGMDAIKKDPALLKQYTTFANVAQAYDNQISGGQQQVQQQVQQPVQVQQPIEKQPKINLADSIRKIADGIDYSDFNSLNKSGMEMVKKMTDAGVPEEQAMEAVGKRFYSKVKSGDLTKEEYRAFMGDYKTKEERDDEAIVETDKKLHPEKYGIDPFAGLKDFFTGNFDDTEGKKKRANYLADKKNQ